ncbi:pseudouridine synthase, partial [Neoconidiobolus thromboides FSU 785]
LIRIDPYFFIYQCYAKGRWMNKSIYHVFTTEFQDQSTEYYELAILEGRIRVNGCQVSSEYKIKSMDRIQHLIHRHELPVNRFPEIEYIYEDRELLIVNKPSSLPVHPSGRYSHNTLIEMIKHRKKLTKLYLSNRLDRLTSGIVIIGLNEVIAKKIESEMKLNKVSKEYFCRVDGKFPEFVECDQPIKVLDPKLGLYMVHPDGKPSFTRFELVKFNGKSSLVKAIPKTGR